MKKPGTVRPGSFFERELCSEASRDPRAVWRAGIRMFSFRGSFRFGKEANFNDSAGRDPLWRGRYGKTAGGIVNAGGRFSSQTLTLF